jgi:hypothetical protein
MKGRISEELQKILRDKKARKELLQFLSSSEDETTIVVNGKKYKVRKSNALTHSG